MVRYLFDCETNGLLDELDVVHCLVLKNVDTGEVISCADQPGYTPIEVGLRHLLKADAMIAHNAIGFDVPALQKVYSWFAPDRDKVIDTLIISRLIWTNLKEIDFETKNFPKHKAGHHSLGAWGLRLGEFKDDYDGGWDNWSPNMHSYCEQDVEVLDALWQKINNLNYSQQAIDLEHEVQWIVAEQERYGFAFDVRSAEQLLVTLRRRQGELEDQLQEVFPPFWVGKEIKVPKKSLTYKDRKRGDLTEGAAYQKVVLTPFNPGSRHHIASRLEKMRGWKPKEFTPAGQPQIDEVILGKLPYPEAKLLTEYLMVQKRLGQLADGSNAWLKLERGGRIHGRVITNGAATGRSTHSKPNVTQVPSTRKPYGKECRSLFTSGPGKVIVGCDVSGLELRMLAHYMWPWDNGAYGRVILEADVHTHNQTAAGLPTRDNAKTFIYGFMYGAGDAKLGEIVAPNRGPTYRRQHGLSLRRRFLKEIPALGRLTEAVKGAFKEKGHLRGLDGRLLLVRSEHSALNMLLQGAGAIVCKQWMVEADKLLRERGLHNRCQQVATVHDELQFECDEEIAEEVGKALVDAIKIAGERLQVRMPLDGEYKIGKTWADTH